LPALQADLHATITDVQWVIEAYALFLGGLILAGGAWGDQFGRKRTFLIGIAWFTIRIGCLRSRRLDARADRRAGAAGGRCRLPGSGQPGDYHGHVRRRGSREGDRYVVRVQRDHHGRAVPCSAAG
jgi:hypothetical protein